MNKVHYSSKSSEWETPQSLFDKLDAEFCFTLDPCCTSENAKCERYFTVEEDGLSQCWDGEIVYVNPPYGRQIGKWVKKAAETEGSIVVMLIPARTDTRWFHKYILGKAEIRFLKGRLKFINKTFPSYKEDGDFKICGAPFPSMIVIFRGIDE